MISIHLHDWWIKFDFVFFAFHSFVFSMSFAYLFSVFASFVLLFFAILLLLAPCPSLLRRSWGPECTILTNRTSWSPAATNCSASVPACTMRASCSLPSSSLTASSPAPPPIMALWFPFSLFLVFRFVNFQCRTVATFYAIAFSARTVGRLTKSVGCPKQFAFYFLATIM